MMTQPVSEYMTTCQLLASRFAAITGSRARAEVEAAPGGGVVLRYFINDSPESNAEPLWENRLSLIRAVDSLALHVARALSANIEGLELTEIALDRLNAKEGRVNLKFYCPTWDAPQTLPANYVIEQVPSGYHVVLKLVSTQELTEAEVLGWGYCYNAGVVSALHEIMPYAAQATAQLLVANQDLNLTARTVVLPGTHHRLSSLPESSVILKNFEDTSDYWNISTQNQGLIVTTSKGIKQLTSTHRSGLGAAVARWQTIAEAITECLAPPSDLDINI